VAERERERMRRVEVLFICCVVGEEKKKKNEIERVTLVTHIL